MIARQNSPNKAGQPTFVCRRSRDVLVCPNRLQSPPLFGSYKNIHSDCSGTLLSRSLCQNLCRSISRYRLSSPKAAEKALPAVAVNGIAALEAWLANCRGKSMWHAASKPSERTQTSATFGFAGNRCRRCYNMRSTTGPDASLF